MELMDRIFYKILPVLYIEAYLCFLFLLCSHEFDWECPIVLFLGMYLKIKIEVL